MAKLKDKIKNTLDEGRILVIGSQVLSGFHFRSMFEPGFQQLSAHARYMKLGSLGPMVLALALLIWPGKLTINSSKTAKTKKTSAALHREC